MAEKQIINDMKICEKQKEEGSFNNQEHNNSLEDNHSVDNNTNIKTINKEREKKNISEIGGESGEKNELYMAANTTTKKNSILQEKLKNIFKVREKVKYEYNKQEIPENLKYHSDSDSSELSELKNNKKSTENNNNINSRNNNNQVKPKISVKRQKSGCSKNELSLGNKNIKKEKIINEKKSDKENNSPNLPKKNNIANNFDIVPKVVGKNKINQEKSYNNFNKKILDNYLNEINNEEKNEKEEKKQDKNNSIKDIIEKLKAKKIEKEELYKKEKEAEEQSIMKRKVKNKERKESEEKNNENEKLEDPKEKEKEINDITERIKERKNIRERMKKEEEERIRKEEEEKKRKEEEKRKKEIKEEEKRKEEEEERRKEEEKRKKEIEEENILREGKKKNKKEKSRERVRHYKRSTENSKHENILLPHKVFRDENDDEDEINYFKKQSNILSPKHNNSKNKIMSKEKNIHKKQFELNSKEEIEKEENVLFNKQNYQVINKNKYIIEKNNETNNIAYKKPINKIPNNNRALNVYRPKRPSAARGRSQEKVDQPNLLNKMSSDIFNNSSNNIFSTINKHNNGNMNNARITYTKKRSPVKDGKNFIQLNNSFCGRDNMNAHNNSMVGRGNISNLEINNVNNLNSSFDSMIKNYGANNSFMYNVNLNSSFYNNGKSNTNLFNGRITNSPFINPDNISALNINNFNTNNAILNNMRHQQLLNYEPNSSFSYGYNNALASNLLNNSFLGINNLNNNSFQRSNDYSYSSINIEDLLVLEEKLSEIIITLNKTKIVYNECFEFWNYYYNCSLYGCLEKLFTNIYESNNVKMSINYLLMSIIICYDFSFDMNIINNAYSVLDELLKLNHQNLIIIFEHILTKVSSDSRDNVWVFKLHGIVNSSKNSIRNNKFSSINEYSMSTVEKIIYNTGIIIQNIRVLLKNYDSPKIKNLTSIFKKLNEKTYEDINAFFREYILRVDNMNGSVLASIFLKENNNFKTEPAPYLKTINRKPYSLILDLDETLVHFKVNPENESEGVLRVRPGIIEFLDSIDQYYELIIFTAATQDYADLLIDAVEENKIYFEHRLYRQHTVIIGNDFVKDLSRVGRPLDKIAIVDNMPQNFRLQKENGVNIKAFWGEEVYDTALIDLAPILINIAKEGGDIRNGLAKYKDEIVKKVTSNISKHIPS